MSIQWKFAEDKPINRKSEVFGILDELVRSLPEQSEQLLDAMLTWSPHIPYTDYKDPFHQRNGIDIQITVLAPYLEGLPAFDFLHITKPRNSDFNLFFRYRSQDDGELSDFKEITNVAELEKAIAEALDSVKDYLGMLKSQSKRIKAQQS